MPGKNAHSRQVAHNQQLIAFLDVDSTPYLDWVVTAAFHVAVHLIEQHLASAPIHSKTHAERWSNMAKCKSLKPIYNEARYLCERSRECRYDCRMPKRHFVKTQVLPTLQTIEKVIASL
jgi:hypothetical protein